MNITTSTTDRFPAQLGIQSRRRCLIIHNQAGESFVSKGWRRQSMVQTLVFGAEHVRTVPINQPIMSRMIQATNLEDNETVSYGEANHLQ